MVFYDKQGKLCIFKPQLTGQGALYEDGNLSSWDSLLFVPLVQSYCSVFRRGGLSRALQFPVSPFLRVLTKVVTVVVYTSRGVGYARVFSTLYTSNLLLQDESEKVLTSSTGVASYPDFFMCVSTN